MNTEKAFKPCANYDYMVKEMKKQYERTSVKRPKTTSYLDLDKFEEEIRQKVKQEQEQDKKLQRNKEKTIRRLKRLEENKTKKQLLKAVKKLPTEKLYEFVQELKKELYERKIGISDQINE